MITKCSNCGTHVPKDVALQLVHEGATYEFCSAKCADMQFRDVLPQLPPLPRSILVPIDGSGPSVRAVEMAAMLAAAAHGEVTLLMAVNVGWLRSGTMQPEMGIKLEGRLAEIEVILRENAAAQLERCRRICEQAKVRCTGRIESGPPLEAILAAAKNVELVVMGSRGRDALATSSLGSLAQRVLSGTRTRVLVVH
jgi:nucleotide-binding universal stress UspA family protein